MTLRVQRGRLARRRLRAGARRRRRPGRRRRGRRSTATSLTIPLRGDLRRRRLPGHLPGGLGRLAPGLRGLLLRRRRRRSSSPRRRRGGRRPHRSGGRRRPARRSAGSGSPASRSPSACRCWCCCAGPAAGPSGRLRRLATWGAVAVAAARGAELPAPGPVRRGHRARLAVRPLAALGHRWRRRPAGRCWSAVVLPSALALVLRAGVAPGRAAARRPAAAAGVLARRAGRSAPRPSGTRSPGPGPALAVAVTAVHVAAMAVWLGGLAGAARRWCCGRRRRPATWPPCCPGSPRIAFARRGRARRHRHRAGGPRGRRRRRRCSPPTYGWVLVAKLACWSLVVLARPGSPGSGCSSGSASAGPGRGRDGAADRPRLRRARPSRDPGERRARGRAARTGCSPRARAEQLPVAAPLGAVEFALAAVDPGAVRRAGRHARRPASAVAQPVDVTAAAAGQRPGRRGSVQVSVDPRRPGANVAAPLPVRRRRAGSPSPQTSA